MAKIRKRGSSYMLDFYQRGVRRRVIFGSKLEAQTALRVIERSQVASSLGVTVDSSCQRVLVSDAIYEFMENRSDRAAFKREQAVFEQLYGFLSNEVDYVHQITGGHLQAFQAIRSKTVSPGTVVRDFVTINTFINYCLRKRLIRIDQNPMRDVELPRVSSKARMTWTDEQVDLVLECLPKWASSVVKFFALTGARNIEVQRLTWGDINWQDREASVLSWKNAKSGRRVIPLPDQALTLLKALLGTNGHKKKTDPVFVNDNGNQFSVNHLCKVFRDTRRELGLPEDLQLYGLRHTFASKLCRENVNTFVIKGLMGHSQIKTTERYVHLQRDQLLAASEKIQRKLQTA